MDGRTDVVDDEPVDQSGTTRIAFSITVPAYVSNALRVQLAWGDKELRAAWLADESWAVSDDFPANTSGPLTVTFSDDNGAFVLGTVEMTLETGSQTGRTIDIDAQQFDTARWDDDGDGISNLAERRSSGDADPVAPAADSDGVLLPVSARVELLADKTFRIHWERSGVATSYRVLENPDGVSGYTDVSGELDATTDTFDHRVALHKRINARYIVEACNTGGCAQSVQLLIEGPLIEAIGYFKASNPDARDNFGVALAVSGDGNTLVVGAHQERSAATGVNGDQADNTAGGAGAVYVFERNASGWSQQAYLKASNAHALDEFGSDLSLSDDGDTLLIGAPSEASAATGVDGDQDDRSAPGAGAAYVFLRQGGTWRQVAYLKASNTETASALGEHESFGRAVALSGDGLTLAIGAQGEDSASIGVYAHQPDNSALDSGAVYVFSAATGSWQQEAYVKPATSNSRGFGRALGLSADGAVLAVSVYDYVTGQVDRLQTRGADARDFYGAVYVYQRANSAWRQKAFLRGLSGSLGPFGEALSLSADGNTLAVSEDEAVDVFQRIGSDWEGMATLRASNADVAGGFGRSLSLSDDGSTLAVGAAGEYTASSGLQGYQGRELRSMDSGAAYVFIRGDGSWPQQAFVKASNTFEENSFGEDVSLSADGETLAIGAIGESSGASGTGGDQTQVGGDRWGSGAVYLY